MKFNGSPHPTLGMEIELQLLDPKTFDLVDGILPLMASYPQQPFTKPEYNQATVEINSQVCSNIDELETNMVSELINLQARCEELNMLENHFRASRWGLEAKYIENSQGHARPIKQVIADILDSLRLTAAELGETKYLQLVCDRLEKTPNYIRQRQIWQTTGSQQAVVAFLVRQMKQELQSKRILKKIMSYTLNG